MSDPGTGQLIHTRLPADPESHTPHFAHGGERIWSETNCYVDLWIELLHGLGADPVPSLASVFSADHDGLQWTFLKQQPEDLRALYGIEVSEDSVWLPLLETVEAGPGRGVMHTVEVDSWWLPDTAGTAYRADHVKTTIVPTHVDRDASRLNYLHNGGHFTLSGDDFDGIFFSGTRDPAILTPYVEQIRVRPETAQPERLAAIVRGHLDRRAVGDPIERLGAGVHDALAWLPEHGLERFHQWAFVTLRQCGATAELASDLCRHLAAEHPGALAAVEPFLTVASTAKLVQLKLARAARGRTVDVSADIATMSASWNSAMEAVSAAVP